VLTFDSGSIQVQKISDSIYSHLKKMILQGELPPGHRLLVLEIAQYFDDSQAPVREALERLKHEGLISGKSNKGSVVSDVTHKEIQDISVIREILEGFKVRETLALCLTSKALTAKGVRE
jgi:DNA-binding GntR family transcriptional regulator